MDELTQEFLVESQDGLDRMERCLTELEQRPEDKELLSEIFRAVHTIKGTTGFLGFTRLEKLAHAGENLLGVLRDGKLSANQPIITGLLQLMDGLRDILRTIEAENSEGEEEDFHLIELMLELQRSRDSDDEIPVLQIERTQEPTDAYEVEPNKPAAEDSFTARPEPASDVPPPKNDPNSPIEAKPPATPASESSLRVSVALLNRLMNLVGELVLTRNQILQATAHAPNLTLLSHRLDLVTADLRESVMQARMQPVSNVFSKFTRIVRDLSQMLHRQVRLELEGQDTELDKSLLEAIKDPLTHAVRNSLDHGIEPPDVRIAKGKNPEGVLRLRAYQQSGHVVIEVSDDGAGIGVERVRAKAIERGLISAEHAAQLAERELLQLIFLPGFSTAEAVTNVSGRGVGMDVVRNNIEQIGGKVEIESRSGNGTTLRFRIPLTLAIIPALIVRSLDQSFALPQAALSELVHVATGPHSTSIDSVDSIEWIQGTPLYRLRGQLLPLVFLDQVLDPTLCFDPLGNSCICSFDPAKRQRLNNFIAVLEVDGRRFGLVVDGLRDPEEIVVKPLSAILKSIGIYSGATILGNGDLALILDLGEIASRCSVAVRSPTYAVAAGRADKTNAQPQFLLVKVSVQNDVITQAAIPLDQVLRIERVPLARVEYLGSQPLLNFDGHMLPVEDYANALALGTRAVLGTTGHAPLIVIICREQSTGVDRELGVAVIEVLDIAPGGDLFESGSESAVPGIVLFNESVTPVIDLAAVPALNSERTGSFQGARAQQNQLLDQPIPTKLSPSDQPSPTKHAPSLERDYPFSNHVDRLEEVAR